MRSASVALLAHLQQVDTTTCRLLKITTRSDITFGLCTLDVDIDYDDGDGEITYYATQGFDPSAFRTDTGYAVDNAEAMALLQESIISSNEVPGIDLEMVEAGEFTDATWRCVLVNFKDLSMGHMELGFGDIGETTTRYGMLWIPELLSIMDRFKQPIGEVWSLRCRAIFGSPADSPTGCGVDAEALWVTGEVESVGAETNRSFVGSAVGSPYSFPGRVQFLTGKNAGPLYATEALDSGSQISLSETAGYPIEIGDTYRIRPDCAKRFTQDCIGVWDNGINFKGEPHIPLGDAAQVLTPEAQTPPRKNRFKSA